MMRSSFGDADFVLDRALLDQNAAIPGSSTYLDPTAAAHPNVMLDGILWGGWHWTTPGSSTTIINYYLASPGQFTFFDAGWTTVEANAIRAAFQSWSNVANIQFVQVANASSATFIEHSVAGGFWPTQPGFVVWGEHDVPDNPAPAHGYYNWQAPGWDYNNANGGLQVGGLAYLTLVHEIGHGIGLAHPHDRGGGSSIWPGVTGPFGSYGSNNLNQSIYTVMSYNRGWDAVLDPQGQGITTYGYNAGPSAFDIAAVQYLYGPNTNFHSGGDTYVIPDVNASGTYWTALWDTGGSDTIVYNGSKNAVISLVAATLDNSPTGGGVLSYASGINGGYTIANGVVIENATGGSGADTITGNSADNRLRGNGGDDIIDGGGGNDIAFFSRARSEYTFTDLGSGRLRISGPDGTDTLTSIETLWFLDQIIGWPNHAPTMNASNVALNRNQVVSASSLFNANDSDGDELSYWFRDNTIGGGRFEYDGIAKPEGQTFGILQSQLSRLTFRAGNSGTSDSVSVNAWDGLASSSVVTFNINVTPNVAPTIGASSVTVKRGQVLAASSLFGANDANGDELSYWFRDNTIGGGRFEFNGIAQAEGQTFGVSRSQLSLLTFRAGGNGVSDNISVNAWDGLASSGIVSFNVNVEPNFAPVVNASSMTVTHGKVLSAASLFGAGDANGDELSYWFRDNTIGGGRFEFNGIAQAEGQTFGVSASQLPLLTFRAGANGTDNISFNAWDGQASSGVVAFNVHVAPNSAPAVTTSSMTVKHGQVLAATSLFGASDADGDALSYWFRDNTIGGGHFEFNGVAQPEGQTFGVSQSQLSLLTFRAGNSGSDNISFNAWDGQASSAAMNFNIHVAPNQAPTVSASSIGLGRGQVVSASSLFNAGDADGDALSYWFRDNTIGGGHFEFNGVAQPEGQTFGVSQSQLALLTFRAATSGSDSITLNAWDGQASSPFVTFQLFV